MDNVVVMGGSEQDAQTTMAKIADRFRTLNIPFEVDQQHREQLVEVLGLEFFMGTDVLVTNKRRRVWRVWMAIGAVLHRKRVHGKFIQILLGHINHLFQLCRPALSSLSACYRFVADHSHHRYPLWPGVRREFDTVRGLIFLVEFNMSSPLLREVYVGDSSDKGYALMVTDAAEAEVRPMLAFRERWRFISSWDAGSTATETFFDAEDPADDSFEPIFYGSKPEAGVGCRTQFGVELKAKYEQQSNSGQLEAKRRRLFGKRAPDKETWIQGPRLVPVPETFMAPQRWSLLVSAAWKRPEEHINIKEARVCLMSLRRICRTTANLGSTALTLTDNLVSALVFERGRSSSHGLNGLCKRAAAYQIACRIQWRLRHIPSEMNVSDGPSRRWGPDEPVRKSKPSGVRLPEEGDLQRRRRVGLETMAGHFPAHSEEIVNEPSSSSTVRVSSTQTTSPPKFFLSFFPAAQD